MAPAAGCSLAGRLPLHEERQLRVGLQPLDADLLPAQLEAVGPVPVALHGLAAEPGLDRGDVVDGDDPAEPAAAERGAGAHRLAERRLVGGRVVEHLDDLEVGALAVSGSTMLRVPKRGWMPPSRNSSPSSVAEAARRCPRARPVRRRTRVVQAHTQHSHRGAPRRRDIGGAAAHASCAGDGARVNE